MIKITKNNRLDPQIHKIDNETKVIIVAMISIQKNRFTTAITN